MIKTTRRPRSPRPRPTARDGDTEQRILDAAHAVFVRRGTAGARMQEIADDAGVNKALLHYYFRSKSRLAAAVFERAARGLFERLGDALGADAPLADKVTRVIGLYLDQLVQTPFLPGYVLAEFNQDPGRVAQFGDAIRRMRQRGIEALDRQIKAEIRAGTIRPIATHQFIVNLVSLCIFPFAARPMLGVVLGMDARGFERFIDERKKTLPQFFLAAVRP